VRQEGRRRVEFLVHIEAVASGGDSSELHEQLTLAEHERVTQLVEGGVIRRLWRVPGRRENWGIWEAPDATALHAEIASLPLFPQLNVTVHPLAKHPLDPSTLRANTSGDSD